LPVSRQRPMPLAGAAARDEPPVLPPPAAGAEPSTGGCEPVHLLLETSRLEVCRIGSVPWAVRARYRWQAFCPPLSVTGLESLDFVPFAAELNVPEVGIRYLPTLVPVVCAPQHRDCKQGQQQVVCVQLQLHHEHGRPTGLVHKQLKPNYTFMQITIMIVLAP